MTYSKLVYDISYLINRITEQGRTFWHDISIKTLILNSKLLERCINTFRFVKVFDLISISTTAQIFPQNKILMSNVHGSLEVQCVVCLLCCHYIIYYIVIIKNIRIIDNKSFISDNSLYGYKKNIIKI